MNYKEACSILELSPDATPEEAKKQYKKLAKTLHPDVNKASDAEDNFKKINEAYKRVQEGNNNSNEFIHNPFGKNGVMRHVEHIDVYSTISFKDSVLGLKQDVKFTRSGKCNKCNGRGEVIINNGCDKCGGRGQIVNKDRGMIFMRPCDKCGGKANVTDCNSCNGFGSLETEVSINVTIPGGVVDGNILRLNGMGNFVGNFMGFEQFTDAHLHISVWPEAGLSISGINVISNLDITLLEALSGCSKTVKTILGDKDIDIKPLSKNSDEINIPNLGVNKLGNQKVILNVNYPTDVSNLIDLLKDKEN